MLRRAQPVHRVVCILHALAAIVTYHELLTVAGTDGLSAAVVAAAQGAVHVPYAMVYCMQNNA